MASIDPNVLIPAIAGIAGALVGAIASIIPNFFADRYKHKREAKLVEASLVAEIRALMEIADEREYFKVIDLVCAHLEKQPEGTLQSITIRVPEAYSRIYQTHAHQIGIINPKKASAIVRFHQLIDAVVQDVRPGGALSLGAPLASYQQALEILKKAFSVGNAICFDESDTSISFWEILTLKFKK